MASEHQARTWSRRQLLALSAGGLAYAHMTGDARAEGVRQVSQRPWGVQLYTVRDRVDRDPAAILKALARIGYKELEVLQPTLSVVVPLARTLGLSVVSVHLDGPTSAGEGLPAFITRAKDHGLRYLVIAWVPPGERPTDRAGFERLAGRFSRMGEQVARAGMQLCYHNHAFEFGKGSDGARWLDVLMKATEAAHMQLELDVFWASVTGAQPVDVIKQHAGRIALMHLKDKSPRAAATLREDEVPKDAFVEVGSGALDFKAILAAARAAGVEHFFVEQDFTPGDPVASLEKSYRYLAGLGV